MRHFLSFCALRKIKKLMRERGSKCATFAQNHNIWTHWMWVCQIDSVFTVLCLLKNIVHQTDKSHVTIIFSLVSWHSGTGIWTPDLLRESQDSGVVTITLHEDCAAKKNSLLFEFEKNEIIVFSCFHLSKTLLSISVTRSRDFARNWRFLKATRALKFPLRALREI